MPEITSKPTPRQIEALRIGAAHDQGIIEPSADKRTHEGLVGRGLADWTAPERLGRSVWGAAVCVITEAGRQFLRDMDARAANAWMVKGARVLVPSGKATVLGRTREGWIRLRLDDGTETITTGTTSHRFRLCVRCDAPGDESMPPRETAEGWLCGLCAAQGGGVAPEGPVVAAGPQEGAQRAVGGAGGPVVTREDVAAGVEEALRWVSFAQRARLRGAAASEVLGGEFKRAGAVMRRVLRKKQGPLIERQCVDYYGRVSRLLAAARRFEAEDARRG